MVQSGHRSYDQDGPNAIGEDNWRYIADDWAREPAKPVIDGDPSYENIPHGLYKPAGAPRWQAPALSRYPCSAISAGSLRPTYCSNLVLASHLPQLRSSSYEHIYRWPQH